MVRHIQARHAVPGAHLLACPLCNAAYKTSNSRQIHVKQKHGLALTAKEIEQMAAEPGAE